jgi:hypothetical protein
MAVIVAFVKRSFEHVRTEKEMVAIKKLGQKEG